MENKKRALVLISSALAAALVFTAPAPAVSSDPSRYAPHGISAESAPSTAPAAAAAVDEGFETSVPPPGWSSHVTNGGDATYTWHQSSLSALGGTYSATVLYDPTPSSQEEVLYTSEIPAGTTPFTLSFWSLGSVFWCRDDSDNCDLTVWIDRDTAWGNGNETYLATADEDWPGDWTWARSDISIPPSGTAPLYIAFVYSGSDGAQISVDNVSFVSESKSLTVAPPSGTYASSHLSDLSALLLVGGVKPKGGRVLLNGKNITALVLDTVKIGTVSPEGLSFRWPGLVSGLTAGTHSLTVSVDLSDGTTVEDTVLWAVAESAE